MALKINNEIAINAKILNAARKKQFIGLAKNAANTRLIAAKQELIKDIDEHPISLELQPGQESKPDSELISDGSLRAFLGFYPEDNPVKDLKDYFNENIEMSNEPKISDNGKNKIYYNFPVSIPSMTQMEGEKIFESPNKWSSKSWISLIEKGTSTAIHFVMAKLEETAEKFSKGGSRSGWGLQRKKVFSGRVFSPKKYVSELIQNFRNRFK